MGSISTFHSCLTTIANPPLANAPGFPASTSWICCRIASFLTDVLSLCGSASTCAWCDTPSAGDSTYRNSMSSESYLDVLSVAGRMPLIPNSASDEPSLSIPGDQLAGSVLLLRDELSVLFRLHPLDIHFENFPLSPALCGAVLNRLVPGPISGRRSGTHASITASEGSTAVMSTAVTEV